MASLGPSSAKTGHVVWEWLDSSETWCPHTPFTSYFIENEKMFPPKDIGWWFGLDLSTMTQVERTTELRYPVRRMVYKVLPCKAVWGVVLSSNSYTLPYNWKISQTLEEAWDCNRVIVRLTPQDHSVPVYCTVCLYQSGRHIQIPDTRLADRTHVCRMRSTYPTVDLEVAPFVPSPHLNQSLSGSLKQKSEMSSSDSDQKISLPGSEQKLDTSASDVPHQSPGSSKHSDPYKGASKRNKKSANMAGMKSMQSYHPYCQAGCSFQPNNLTGITSWSHWNTSYQDRTSMYNSWVNQGSGNQPLYYNPAPTHADPIQAVFSASGNMPWPSTNPNLAMNAWLPPSIEDKSMVFSTWTNLDAMFAAPVSPVSLASIRQSSLKEALQSSWVCQQDCPDRATVPDARSDQVPAKQPAYDATMQQASVQDSSTVPDETMQSTCDATMSASQAPSHTTVSEPKDSSLTPTKKTSLPRGKAFRKRLLKTQQDADLEPLPKKWFICLNAKELKASHLQPLTFLMQYSKLVDVEVQDKEECCICMELLKDASGQYEGSVSATAHQITELVHCKHKFHLFCLRNMYIHSHKGRGLSCPVCKTVHGQLLGNCPDSTMEVVHSEGGLPGYTCCGLFRIIYTIPGGIQTSDHPNPGQLFTSIPVQRTAYLPDTRQARKVLKMLMVAFSRGLTFTIGFSATSGGISTVVWNEIHHKTRRRSCLQSSGFLDAGYLDRVTRELAQHGVSEKDTVGL